MRLDKWLAHAGLGTRRDVRTIVKDGRVRVNGTIATRPDMHVHPEQDHVECDRQPVLGPVRLVLAMHKPEGVVSARRDERHDTVIDCLPERYRRRDFHVAGRLDKDVTGLLVLTTDTALVHDIISPRKQVYKTYDVTVDATLPSPEALLVPRNLKDGRKRPYVPRPPRIMHWEGRHARIAVCEGKHHQVKRMFKAIGVRVVALKRVAIGALALGELPVGEVKRLSQAEIDRLFDDIEERER